MKKLPLIPASFFGSILGIVGLGNCWREASVIWGFPREVGESLMALGVGCWGLLLLLYGAKWLYHPKEALAELRHPILCCFVGVVPLTFVLMAIASAPYSGPLGIVLWTIGALGQIAFSVYRTGQLWQGGREIAQTTPVLYLPSVAGNFVTCIGANALGLFNESPLFFGAGLFSWLAVESVILNRFLNGEMMAKSLRPTFGIQLAPPVVGCAAYLGLHSGPPDLFAQFLLGYGLLQAVLLLRLSRWLHEQPFGSGYWSYTFGISALALVLMRFVEKGMPPPFPVLAPIAFGGANGFIGGCAIWSVILITQRRYLPPALTEPEVG